MGDPTRRIPSSVTRPASALANIRDLATLYVEDHGARALSSDLSSGTYYTGAARFAVRLDGRDACFLLPRAAVGKDFRPVTYRPGDQGDYDSGGLGAAPGLLSTSGTFGWIAECVEQVLTHEPLVLDEVEVARSTDRVTISFGASDTDLDLIGDFIDDAGDEDGVALGSVTFTLLEDGQQDEQARPLEIWVAGGRIHISFPVGLKAYGYHALRDVRILPTGNAVLDDILDEAAPAIGRRLNPTVVDATAGRMQGDHECQDRPGTAA